MSEPVLELSNATVKKGDATVLHGLSLKIVAGEHTVILGSNGAGKSVLVRLLTHEDRARAPARRLVSGAGVWRRQLERVRASPATRHRFGRPASPVRQRQQRRTHHRPRGGALGLHRVSGDPPIRRRFRRDAPPGSRVAREDGSRTSGAEVDERDVQWRSAASAACPGAGDQSAGACARRAHHGPRRGRRGTSSWSR